MGQDQVVEFVIKHPNKSYTVENIARKLKVSKKSVTRAIRKIKKHNHMEKYKNIEIKMEKIPKGGYGYLHYLIRYRK